jgi:hypothetical protein
MKILLIILGLFLLIFIGVQIFALSSQHNIETYAYTVSKKYDAFEIRRYEASLFTSVKLNTNNYKDASGKGFSVLAGYIFGGNEKNESIAMTSPVAMTLGDSMVMMFKVPEKIEKEMLPKPNQPQVEFREEPAKTAAAIRFGGWTTDKKIEAYKQKLITALDKEGIPYTNNFQFLGYNAPYEVFNRRNEIIVELQ